MGFFLSSLQSELTAFEMKVKQWAEPLDKVRDYHGVFKSVCDTFVIRREQFSQIFGSEEKLILWQGNSTINALQVFCGLGFYSSCSGFRLKLKFLFALFDFNEIKSISVVDLEYMILSILNFTYRILGRINSRADELRLAEWLMRYVNPHKRININSLARFCHQSEDARKFLKMSGNLEGETENKPNEIYDQEKDMQQSERETLMIERKQVQINTKLAWFINFTQKLTKPKYKKEIISTSSIAWVYGIDLTRFHIPFIVLGDGRILYAISTKIVIYCINGKSQNIYSRHTKEVQCFAAYQSSFTIASSEGQISPKIHIWDFRTLQTLHILRLDHSNKVHLLAFSPLGTLVAVGARQQSPVVLFDSKENFKLRASFAVDDFIHMLTPFFSPLELQNLPQGLLSMFVLAGKKKVLVVDSKQNQHAMRYESNITSVAVSYMSSEQPYLRYFTGPALRLYIVTSHESGAVIITIFDPQNIPAFTEAQKYELFKFDEPPKQIILTAESFLIVLLSEVRVYDLNIFTLHEDKAIDADHSRIIRCSDLDHLRLLSHQLLFAAINQDFIFLISKEGDFLQISDREIDFDGNLREQENIKRLDEFVKLGGKLRALCFAQRERKGTLLVVSENKKVFEIDPENHKVSLILEIGYEDVITVIDYAVSEEGPAYTVCGSLSGRLLVRIDEEEIAKVYDCQTEVADLKISRDASYLLVATLNSVMFFQLLPSFSSPRKITFENESPNTLNFLDNPRFCSVGTSAKNIYLIEVPQLRHRNVQKDNQSFSATRMAVDFPHRLQNPSSRLSYSRCFVGGDMKFYLLTLTTGELLFFPSMSSLAHKNYILIRAHQCPISNVVLSEDQSLFYTIGQSDCMLLEWSVHEQRPPFIIKQEQRDFSKLQQSKLAEMFKRIKLASEILKSKQENLELCTFFFRGTRSDKLNHRLHQSLHLNTENLGEEEAALMKRHCRAYLKMNAVYGLESNKAGQVRYLSHRTDDSRLLYTASRFLIETEGEGSINERIYEHATHIAYFSLSELGEPVYAESGHCPRIFVSGVEAMRTLHKSGLIHFTLYAEFILSFGLQNQCYSINLHNYRTGQLIAERTTYHPITMFLMPSANDFVSLPEVRIWHGLIASQSLGIAQSGAVLPGKDICLGGMKGQLSILSQNGIFLMATNAHSKQIIAVQINQLPNSFEIITASLDETVKIWNEYLEQLLTINLSVPGEFKILRELDAFGISDSNIRYHAFSVRSLDCKHNQILLAMSIGQIWEYQISKREEKIRQSQDLNSSGNISSDSNEEKAEDAPLRSQRVQTNYYVQRKRILNAHSSISVDLMQRFVAFDVHSQFPLFVSAGSDSRVIFRDYLREEVVGNYICQRDEQVKVRALKFSPRGRMIVVGLTTGAVMTFFMDFVFKNTKISLVQLRHFQTLKVEVGGPYQVIALQFNEFGDMFAVSYAKESSLTRQRSGDPRQSAALIRIYKAKSEKNNNTDEAFYEYRDQIRLREQETATKTNRYAVRLQFENQLNKNYLFLTEEFFDSQGTRLFSTRGRYSVYCLEDKTFLGDEFAISWERASFPGLINLRYHDPRTDQTQDTYTITAMLRYNDLLIYGGIDGKIHLLKLESLDIYEQITEYRVTDMCQSRVYSALTSPITDLRIAKSDNRKFLFVGGYGSECIVKFELIMEEAIYFLEHQPYPLKTEDSMREYLNRQHFYLTINNRQPLREELSNILEDVESQAKSGMHLQFVKAYGRRAIDRRYNLTYFDDSLLYSLGPNLVVQNLKSSSQYLLKADPSPFSHCPQISAFHYNNRFLIVATQQQRSNVYVWDIKSKSCINSMQIECSFVINIRFLAENYAVYYGINDKYEPIISIIDWRNKRTIGSMRLAFTGLSAVRDLTPISLKGGKQFVTCGYLHLCYWQMRGDTLVYHNFNTQSSGRYICIKQLNSYLVTGCEEGHLYLWHDLELIYILHNAHAAAVRCLEVDMHNELLISGGMDGLILFLKIEENKLCPFNRAQLNKSFSKSSIEDSQNIESYEIELQIQSLSANPSLDNEEYETLLVGTRSGSIFEIQYSESKESSSLLFEHHDNQTFVSATFSSYDSQSFFTLTNAGLIERYNINTLKRTMRFDLGQRALKIESCGEFLLICCRQQLMAYRIMIEQGSLERSDSFCIDTRKLEEEGKQIEIIRFCLSKSEKLLAICVKNCSKEPTYQIHIYNLSGECLHQLSNLKHQVDYLDFSVDDKYLLFKDRYEEIGMISLEKQFRRINTIFVEMGIEWQQEALRLSPNAQSIYYSYSCENKITALSRLGNDKLIVGDQMGTVRIFDYPCPDDRLGELHLHCYCVHMNDIAEIVVHPQLTYVLSIGLQDRSLVLWRVAQ